MNIADRPRYYDEMYGVLHPRGRLATQDVAMGNGGDVQFPVMWADRREISFLRPPEDTRVMLEATGFRVLHWVDNNTETALAEAEAEPGGIAGTPATPPILGIHLVVGPSFGEKMQKALKAMVEVASL